MLGHATLQATEIYTHVSIRALKEIHAATHPGAALGSSHQAEDVTETVEKAEGACDHS